LEEQRQRRKAHEEEINKQVAEKPARERQLELQTRRRGRNWVNEEEEDEYCDDDLPRLKHNMLVMVRRMEHYRNSLTEAAEEFEEMLEDSPQMAKLWASFTKLGGIGSHELEKHLDGKIIRAKHQITKKHLRLVANRQPMPITMRRRHQDDDDVA
jgi:hypothetical protein